MIEEADRDIQLNILKNTAKDSVSMKLIAALTALFLPGTFIAVSCTIQRLLLIYPVANISVDTSHHSDVQLGQSR